MQLINYRESLNIVNFVRIYLRKNHKDLYLVLFISIPHTLRFPPTSSHKKCSINIVKKLFENKFFQETVVTTFAFKQSSSYITQNIIVQMLSLVFYERSPFDSYNVVLCKISQKHCIPLE